jgi:hypothetical protein
MQDYVRYIESNILGMTEFFCNTTFSGVHKAYFDWG